MKFQWKKCTLLKLGSTKKQTNKNKKHNGKWLCCAYRAGESSQHGRVSQLDGAKAARRGDLLGFLSICDTWQERRITKKMEALYSVDRKVVVKRAVANN